MRRRYKPLSPIGTGPWHERVPWQWTFSSRGPRSVRPTHAMDLYYIFPLACTLSSPQEAHPYYISLPPIARDTVSTWVRELCLPIP